MICLIAALSGDALSMRELQNDMIQISNPLGDTAVTIARYGDEYAVYVRAYDSHLGRSYGVLVDGCSEIDTEDIIGTLNFLVHGE